VRKVKKSKKKKKNTEDDEAPFTLKKEKVKPDQKNKEASLKIH